MHLLYPGSFDPPHLGHLGIIRRAAALAASAAGKLTVGVAVHPDKPGFLARDQRVALLQSLLSDLPHVDVIAYRGATLHEARRRGICALVRGLRHASDLEHEQAMAAVHRQHGLETIFLAAAANELHLSSHLVRQTLAAGLPLTGLVPDIVAAALHRT